MAERMMTERADGSETIPDTGFARSVYFVGRTLILEIFSR